MEIVKIVGSNECPVETAIHNRGVTMAEHSTKMQNLTELAKSGYRVIHAVRHDKYTVKGKDQYYNPYNDTWYGAITKP